MIDNLIQNVNEESLSQFLRSAIPTFKPLSEDLSYIVDGYDRFSGLKKLGEAQLSPTEEILAFCCKHKGRLSERSAKKLQYEIAKKAMNLDRKEGAIFVFFDQAGNFRFSFIRRVFGEKEKRFTNWKRYTYYVQPHKNNRTFVNRISGCTFRSLEEIQEAFSVEQLSKQFYRDLSSWYFASLKEVDFPNDLNEDEDQLKAISMIRLITRLMFVWFMRQKDLIPEDLFDKKRIDELIIYEDKTGSTYYKAILQNLFFATLNTPMDEGRSWVSRNNYGVQNYYRYKRFIKEEEQFLELMNDTPFLNGGLFENLDNVHTEDPATGRGKEDIRVDCFSDNPKNEPRLKVPDYLFFGSRRADISQYFEDDRGQNIEVFGIIDILSRYDFTIDENTPDDMEVALDPELLGTVFENLLASYNPETQDLARNESGSFYTPRVVVDYMVKETLSYYLADAVGKDKSEINRLFDKDEKQEINQTDRRDIIQSISEIKILDPACGSGAFPMGCLQKMVQLLNHIDPDNEYWKFAQKEKLRKELNETLDESDYEDLKANLEQVFENQLNDPDYARKLYLIQNCLYGVDIQPIAMQISKLRFFISLLVEQEIDEEKENKGILALPNLETKFVAANSLIKLRNEESNQLALKNPEIQKKEDELVQVREKYFNARTSKTKGKYRSKDQQLRNEISDLLVNDGWPNDIAKKIAKWDLFNANSKSNWFDSEWMFGVSKFDIIIGNPPYIQLQKAYPGSDHKYADLYTSEGYDTFERSGDIYALFYEMALNNIKESGMLCFITSNKWMRAKYGESLREFLANKNPLQLIDLGPGIFEAATVDTNIAIIQKRKANRQLLKAVTLENKHQIEQPDLLEFNHLKDLNGESWIVLTPEEQAIKDKIERIGTPLKDWDININRGILTGYNKAFIIDGDLKNKLIAEDPQSAEILQPILRGRDIKQYKVNFADLWLIATLPAKNLNIDKYPAIKRYLWGLKPKLIQEGKLLTNEEKNKMIKHAKDYGLELSFSKKEKSRKKTSNKWFEIQDSIGYFKEFDKEKIVYIEIQTDNVEDGYEFPCFTIADEGSMVLNTAYIITGNFCLEYLVALLNSTLGSKLVKYYVTQLQKRQFRMLAMYVENFPIPIISKERQSAFEKPVSSIIQKRKIGEAITSEESLIDAMVYKIFGFNYDDILIIDPETRLGREEYNEIDI